LTGSSATKKSTGIIAAAALAASAAEVLVAAITATNQIGRQRLQSIVFAFRPAVFDRHVLALGIAGFL
jgi:hypothetical protein